MKNNKKFWLAYVSWMAVFIVIGLLYLTVWHGYANQSVMSRAEYELMVQNTITAADRERAQARDQARAAIVKELVNARKTPAIVYSIDASGVVTEICRATGFPIHLTPAGIDNEPMYVWIGERSRAKVYCVGETEPQIVTGQVYAIREIQEVQ